MGGDAVNWGRAGKRGSESQEEVNLVESNQSPVKHWLWKHTNLTL